MRKTQNPYLLRLTFCLLFCCLFAGCQKDTEPIPVNDSPQARLLNNAIVISEIIEIPPGVTFDKLRVEVSGVDWEIIDVIEAAYIEGVAVLQLPTNYSHAQLCKAVRDNDYDYTGYWRAATNNTAARVAEFSGNNIFAYDGEKRVGRVFLTDWLGEGSSVGKSYVYYHYADRPFTLSGTYGSYKFEASFKKGWNAYINTNLSEKSAGGTVLCTTSIEEEAGFVWRFESYAY